MRLTRSGWVVVAAAILVVVLGRVLGLLELYAVGAASGLLVAVSAGWVAVRNIDLSVARRVRPQRVHAGNSCTVEIDLKNLASTNTPVLRLLDPVTNTSGADLLLPPVGRRVPASVAYHLPTSRRGVLTVGPMRVVVADPFGLAAAGSVAAAAVEVTVLPRVDDISPLPRSIGPDPDGPTESGSLGRSGDEFAALREYHVGDDLRFVHWPSTARTGDLLVRQHDVPWQGRVCIAVDLRRQSADAETFERVVSAAASILRSHIRRGDHVRLVTTTGLDSGYGVGRGHLDSLLEHLAVVSLSSAGSLGGALGLASRGASGALVFVSGHPTPTDLEIIEGRTDRFRLRRIVRFDETGVRRIGRRTDVIGAGTRPFADVWSEGTAALGTRRRRQRNASDRSGPVTQPAGGR